MELTLTTVEAEPEFGVEPPPYDTDEGLLARVGGALLRTVREAVWSALDLQTEFEVLNPEVD